MTSVRAASILVTLITASSLRAQSPADVAGTYAVWECDTACTVSDTATAPLTGFLVLSRTPLEPDRFPLRFRRSLVSSARFLVHPGEVANACVYWQARPATTRPSTSSLNIWSVNGNYLNVRLYASPDALTVLNATIHHADFSGIATASQAFAGPFGDSRHTTRIYGRRIGDEDILKCLPGVLKADTMKTGTLSAIDIVNRIREHSGVTLPARTVDTFKAGEPTTPVKGIAVTMMATLDVLKRAAAHGANLIITHEPTFYASLDTANALTKEGDETFAEKSTFIKEKGLVIWRFHDTPHAMNPDMITAGMARAIGWARQTIDDESIVFDIQPTTLSSLSAFVGAKLGAKAARIAGDPGARVSRGAFIRGFAGFTANRHSFQKNKVDVLIIGEDHEWETVEYAVDAISAGKLKGLIVVGHVPSEQAGMEEVTRWLKTFITEVPIEFIPTGDLLARAPQPAASKR